MKAHWKKLFALMMTVVMLVSILPIDALAAIISTEHSGGFSLRSIVTDKVDTYEFKVDGASWHTQKVKNGDTLNKPQAPEKDHYAFEGWEENGALFNGFGTVSNASGVTHTLTAKWTQQYNVIFYDDHDRIGHSVVKKPGETVNAMTEGKAVVVDSGMAVVGWYTDKQLQHPAGTVQVQDKDIALYPKVQKGFWLNFATGGGTFYLPTLYLPNQPTENPGSPERPGYNFSHWSKQENGSEHFNFGGYLTADTTLHAVWTPAQTKFTILYWIENADDTNYTYEASRTATALSDSLLDDVPDIDKTGSVISAVYRKHFTYDHHDMGVKAKGNGTSVVNVYYRRNTYKLTFNLGNSASNTMTIGGTTYTGGSSSAKYEINAKFNASIGSIFPTKSHFNSGSTFFGWSGLGSGLRVSKVTTMTDEFCQSDGITATANYRNTNVTSHLYYMFESTDQTSGENSPNRKYYNGKYYDKSEEYSQDAPSQNGSWNQKQISYMTAVGIQQGNVINGQNDVFLYYNRHTFNLDFYNYNAPEAGHSYTDLMWGSDISQYNYTPTRPAELNDKYQFTGWYTTKDCVELFNWGVGKMPTHNQTLYAGWKVPDQDVFLNIAVTGAGEDQTIKVPYGQKIQESQLPNLTPPENTRFGGWTYHDDVHGDVIFNLDTPIYAPITLTPLFINLGTVRLVYHANGATGAEPVDNTPYSGGAEARVIGPGALKYEGKVFIGWSKSATDKVNLYQPNQLIKLPQKNLDLYAIWDDIPQKAKVTYHENFPGKNGTHVSDAFLANDEHVLLQNMFTPDTGWQFVAWSTQASGGTQYQPGARVRFDHTPGNDLYAVWKKIDYKLTYRYEGTVPSGAPAVPAETTKNYQDQITVAAVPSLAGYNFDGWKKDGTVTTSFAMPASSVTLTGSWSKKTDLSYTVHYYWNGTTTKIQNDKTVQNKTFQEVVTESPAAVGGHTAVSSASQNLTIGANSSQNVITFYYYKNLELTANSAEKTYNGQTQKVEGYTGAPAGVTFSPEIKVSAEGLKQGIYPAKFPSGTLNRKDTKNQYIITKATDGQLKINPIGGGSSALVVTAKSKTKVYDAQAMTEAGFDLTQGSLASGDRLVVVTSGTITNVGTEPNKVVSVKVMHGSEDVTSSYTMGTHVNGELKVTKRPITFTSATDTKEYDGKDLVNTTVTVGGDNFAGSESATFTVTGKQKEVGHSDNEFTYALKNGAKEENYNITIVKGVLTVNKKSGNTITVTADSQSKVYDGDALTKNTYTHTGTIANGDKLVVEIEGSQTNVGTHANTVKSVKVMRGSTDVSANYTFGSHKNGELKVTKRPVTLTSPTKEKVYDGQPLKDANIVIGGQKFVKNEGVTFNVTGQQLDVGTSVNEFTYAAKSGTDLNNYEITVVKGNLTVKKITGTQLVVKANSQTKVYDGKELKNAGFTVQGTPIAGDEVKATVEGAITDVGTKTNKVTRVVVMRGTVDVTANYTIGASIDGELKITQRPIKMTSDSAKREYNGEELTAHHVTEEGTWAEGEGVTYTFTGKQKDQGKSKNTFDYAAKPNTKLTNYAITKVEGELEVTPASGKITIIAKSDKKIYDGTPLKNAGFTHTGVLAAGDKLEATVVGEITHFGKQANKVTSYKVMRGSVEVTANYIFNPSVDGELEIMKRSVLLTSASDRKEYDGQPLTNHHVDVGGQGFAGTEGADYAFTGSQQDVGHSENKFTYTLKNGAQADDYEIQTVFGELTVTKVAGNTIVLTANSKTKVYDGQPLTDSGYTKTGVLAAGDALVVEVVGTITDVGTKENVVKSYKVMRGSVNVTDNYTFGESVKGELKVTKRPITFTSATDTKEYDGTELTNHEVTVGGQNFAGSESATFTVTGKQKEVGHSDNEFTYTLKNGAKEENYNITIVKGVLTVNKKGGNTITVTADSAEKVYDGDALTKNTYTHTGTIANGDKLVVEIEGSQTNVGTHANTVKSVKVMRGSTDVSANYTFGTHKNGELKITKRPVMLTSPTKEKVYDGKPLKDDKIVIGGQKFAKTEGVTFSVTGQQLDVGTSVNEFTYEAKSGTDLNNYEITVVKGNLTVKKITATQLVVKANSQTKVYDGKELKNAGFTVQGTPIAGDEVKAVITGTITHVGTEANVVTSYKVVRGGVDVTNNYTFGASVNGELKITKRPITLTSGSDTKEYDGQPLTKHTVDVTAGEWVNGEGADYTFTGEQTDLGTSKNHFEFTPKAGTRFEDYEITKVEGDLEITPSSKIIVVRANSKTKMYDGTALKDVGFTFTGELAPGDRLEAVVEGEITDFGTKPNKVTSYRVMRGSAEVTSNYTFGKSIDGELKITKRPVTLTSATASKVYDGQPLTDHRVTVGGSMWVSGEGADYTFTGSQLDLGTSKNKFTTQLHANTKAANYEITEVYGDLTINKITATTIVVTANSKDKIYDGKALTDNGFTFTGMLIPGDELKAVVEGTQKDAGSSDNIVKSYKVMRGNVEVTQNYTFGESVKGKLEIHKRPVQLTSGSGEKPYNGSLLTVHTMDVGASGWANGEGATYQYTGSQLDFGESENTFTYKLNANTKAENYTVVMVNGKLKITKATQQIVLTAKDAVKVYDGDALKQDGFTSVGRLFGQDKLVVTTAGSQLHVGESANRISTYKVMRGATDVTANYAFGASVDGKLTVTKREVTLTSASDAKNYDGTALTNHNVTVGGKKFAKDEGVNYLFTGEQLDVGESDNEFTYTAKPGTDLNDYKITVKFGKLKVKPDPNKITIKANSKTKMYDGTPLTEPTYTMYGKLVAGDKLIAETEGEQLNAGESVNKIKNYRIMRGTLNVTANYQFTPTANGKLTVTKRSLTMTSATDSKEYDASPLTNATVKVTGDGFVAGEGADYTVTGSQLYVGSSENLFTYQLKANTKAVNYDIKTVAGKLTITGEDMKVAKTANDPAKKHALNEDALFTITVQNITDHTLTNVRIEEQAGSGFRPGSYTISGRTATIASIASGETVTLNAVHKIAEADIVKGKFVNHATVTEQAFKKTVSATAQTEEPSGDYTVTKVVANPPAKGYFTLGETIRFTITVTNTGNVTQNSVVVTEQLAGAKILSGDGYTAQQNKATVSQLKPGKSVRITAVYTVQKKDLDHVVKNSITSSGKVTVVPNLPTPNPNAVTPDIPIDQSVAYNGTVRWEDLNNKFKTRPDRYTVSVIGENGAVASVTTDAAHGWAYSFDHLPKHNAAGQVIRYKVEGEALRHYTSAAKADLSEIVNTIRKYRLDIYYHKFHESGEEIFTPHSKLYYAQESYSVASPDKFGYDAKPAVVDGVMTEDRVVHVAYKPQPFTLRINYVYADTRKVAAPSHVETMTYESEYAVTSPVIAGYSTIYPTVYGIMEARNVTRTVFYTPNKTVPIPGMTDKPTDGTTDQPTDGIAEDTKSTSGEDRFFTIINVGECFE